jgi:putative tryptophan/tyrosine transport system substrate-binding protein
LYEGRDLIAGLCSVLVVWPFAARAQQPAAGKWRIGLLMQSTRETPLRQALRDLGYVEGINLQIDARPNDRSDRLTTFAAELVATKPDLIVASGTQETLAVQRATTSIPLVMAASDPVGNRLVG